MIRRLQMLYLRYAAVHGGHLRRVPLGPIWRRCGQIEQVHRTPDGVRIVGWVDSPNVRLSWKGGAHVMVPDIRRPDVAAYRGGDAAGFDVDLPTEAAPLTLEIRRPGRRPLAVAVPDPDGRPSRLARVRLFIAFLRDMLRAAPYFLRYAACPQGRDALRLKIKRALRIDVAARGHLLDPRWFGPSSANESHAQGITIIVPVHNALGLLRRCLARVEANTDLPWRMVLIEDASTDPALRPWVMAWAAPRKDRVSVILHDENMGFVAAVNAGLDRTAMQGKGDPVVLLNSDAMVPPGWASRLIAPFDDPSVASVTPMSNAAEILSVPSIGPGTPLRDGEGDAVDVAARGLGPAPLPELPTGVGFCMALSRAWLARVPRFDPVFGRGYGEEVDWCQKVRAIGGRHLCQPGLFVEHVGGQSFGAEEKARRVTQANRLIADRHPHCDADVQQFIAEDPLQTPRLVLGMALAAQRAPRLPVYLAHSIGGGAEMALMAEVARQSAAVILRVGGTERWQVELHIDGQQAAGRTNDLDMVRQLLALAENLHLIYSCGVGDPDPVTLPSAFLSLRPGGQGNRVSVLIHDYFPLSPSYTLLDSAGTYRGVPATDDPDPAHTARRPDGTFVTLAEWRSAWGALMDVADEVTAFSGASAELIHAAYPDAKMCIRPHEPTTQVRAVVPTFSETIGVLGNLNLQKGAEIMQRIARAHPDQRFVVFGNVDARFALPRNVTVHGGYEAHEITALVKRYRVMGWLMPAIWPETFSFATHEALATGLPVAGFALGAQGAALATAETGRIVALDPIATAPERLFDALVAQIGAGAYPRAIAAE